MNTVLGIIKILKERKKATNFQFLLVLQNSIDCFQILQFCFCRYTSGVNADWFLEFNLEPRTFLEIVEFSSDLFRKILVSYKSAKSMK